MVILFKKCKHYIFYRKKIGIGKFLLVDLQFFNKSVNIYLEILLGHPIIVSLYNSVGEMWKKVLTNKHLSLLWIWPRLSLSLMFFLSLSSIYNLCLFYCQFNFKYLVVIFVCFKLYNDTFVYSILYPLGVIAMTGFHFFTRCKILNIFIWKRVFFLYLNYLNIWKKPDL